MLDHFSADTYVVVFLLDELEEGGQIGSTEVVDGLQSRKHGPVRESLEVVLTDVL